MVRLDSITTDGCQHLANADGAVVVDTGLFGSCEVGIGTVGHETLGVSLVVEPDGTDGPRHIASLARFRAGSILAQ